MELGRHCEPDLGDVSDLEEARNEQEEVAPESAEMRMLRSVLGSSCVERRSTAQYGEIL